jgi:C-terminal processing protease CtpA/Prc
VVAGNRQGPGQPPGKDLVDSLSPGELQKAIETLKANYFRPGEIADGQLQRALLAGILTRIAPGASLVEAGREPVEPNSPFKTETVKESIGYLRLGTLNQSNFRELDAVLKSGTSFGALILDLRATPPSNDFQIAAEILREFCPSGRPLFSIKKEPSTGGAPASPSPSPQQYLSSDQARPFSGPLMILIAKENAGAAEIVAAALRQNAKAILIGETTRGEGVEFADFKLGADKTIRVAVAEVALPDGSVIYPKGLKPDIRVDAPADLAKILAQELEQGVLPFVTETERPRMNEASLVAGKNPELDAMETAQKEKAEKAEKTAPAPLRDSTLQRALDLIATISIYEKERK